MKEKRIIVVGAGGIGSLLSRSIAMTLEWSLPGSALIIVDGDSYEPKNKQRQFFNGVGNKAEVLATELAPQFSKTFVIPIPCWVVDKVKDNGENEQELELDGTPSAGKIAASDLIAEGDVIFAVVDNFKARKQLIDAASDLNDVDVFLGGNDEHYFGSTYHYAKRNGVELVDHPSVWHEEYVDPPDRNPGELSCQERAELEGGTQLLATNMAVTAALLARFNMVIVEGKDPASNSEYFFDLEAGLAQSFDRSSSENITNQLVTQGA
jgi:molybdopterin/thiamine biosynthesis adenylyltransferase